MADRLRRQKDTIKKTISSYLNATNVDYQKYFEGSPTYIIYYQLDTTTTTQDIGLETVNSLVGKNTPNKYKRIYEVPVWGVDALDVSNELSERGLESNIHGEVLFLPNSVRPYPGDFFVFDYDGLESHLFLINEVQYDKVTPQKYFRASYEIAKVNHDAIFENIIGDFNVEYTEGSGGSGTDQISIVSSEQASSNETTKSLIDGLIEKYTKLFYDDESDSFVFKSRDGNNYWSPYLQHFLHETKALTKYGDDFMTEIYISDINEVDHDQIYSEEAYRTSIFRNVEIQNNEVDFDTNFLVISDYNLKCTRNLPFFMSPGEFKLVTPVIKDEKNIITAYMNSFPLFLNTTTLFKDVDHMHKVHKLDDLHIARLEPYLKDGDILYECNRHELEPTKITKVVQVHDGGEVYLEIHDASIERLIKKTENPGFGNMELFNIIKSYLNQEFKITDTITDMLDKFYYKPSLENYILIPMIIFILKESLS